MNPFALSQVCGSSDIFFNRIILCKKYIPDIIIYSNFFSMTSQVISIFLNYSLIVVHIRVKSYPESYNVITLLSYFCCQTIVVDGCFIISAFSYILIYFIFYIIPPPISRVFCSLHSKISSQSYYLNIKFQLKNYNELKMSDLQHSKLEKKPLINKLDKVSTSNQIINNVGKFDNVIVQENQEKGSWTTGEENILYQLHKKVGNKWSVIAKQLEGRTQNQVKNHFYCKMRKSLRKINHIIHDYFPTKFKQIHIKFIYRMVEIVDQINRKNEKVAIQSIKGWQEIFEGLVLSADLPINLQKQQLENVQKLLQKINDFKKKYRNFHGNSRKRQLKFKTKEDIMIKDSEVILNKNKSSSPEKGEINNNFFETKIKIQIVTNPSNCFQNQQQINQLCLEPKRLSKKKSIHWDKLFAESEQYDEDCLLMTTNNKQSDE